MTSSVLLLLALLVPPPIDGLYDCRSTRIECLVLCIAPGPRRDVHSIRWYWHGKPYIQGTAVRAGLGELHLYSRGRSPLVYRWRDCAWCCDEARYTHDLLDQAVPRLDPYGLHGRVVIPLPFATSQAQPTAFQAWREMPPTGHAPGFMTHGRWFNNQGSHYGSHVNGLFR